MSEFDRIIGHETVKNEAKRYCDLLKNPDKYTKVGVQTPSGIMLHGQPGVGKTLLATCIIEECGRNAYVIRKDRAEGEFISYINEIFDEAVKNAPSIILLDDFDKFANSDRFRMDYPEYVSVQTCIDKVRGKNVFVIATVNEINYLPESLRRKGRFDKIIEMTMPRGKEAEDIINYFLSTKELSNDIDMVSIVRLLEGRTCAELECIVNEAGIYAGYDNREKIEEEDLIRACLRVLFDAPECMNSQESGINKRTAVHEAGHALLEEILYPGNVTIVSICNYSGGIGGVTSHRPAETERMTYGDIENRVMILLAGRAATEIVYGELDMGSSEDIKRAATTIEQMITDTGYYDFRAYPVDYISNEMEATVQKSVSSEMMRLYARAKSIIASNRVLFDEYVKQLENKGTLTFKDIAKINNWYLRLVM